MIWGIMWHKQCGMSFFAFEKPLTMSPADSNSDACLCINHLVWSGYKYIRFVKTKVKLTTEEVKYRKAWVWRRLISSRADSGALRRPDLLYSLCLVSYIDTALSGCGVFLCCVVFELCVGFWLNEESHFSHALAANETARSVYCGGDDVQSAVHYQRQGEQSLCLDARDVILLFTRLGAR